MQYCIIVGSLGTKIKISSFNFSDNFLSSVVLNNLLHLPEAHLEREDNVSEHSLLQSLIQSGNLLSLEYSSGSWDPLKHSVSFSTIPVIRKVSSTPLTTTLRSFIHLSPCNPPGLNFMSKDQSNHYLAYCSCPDNFSSFLDTDTPAWLIIPLSPFTAHIKIGDFNNCIDDPSNVMFILLKYLVSYLTSAHFCSPTPRLHYLLVINHM